MAVSEEKTCVRGTLARKRKREREKWKETGRRTKNDLVAHRKVLAGHGRFPHDFCTKISKDNDAKHSVKSENRVTTLKN